MFNHVLEEEPKTIVKSNIKFQLEEEKQVIVHCAQFCDFGYGFRIWPTTYLVTETGFKSKLIYWEGITKAPHWTYAFEKGVFRFTLIFGGLPSDCKVFHLIEEIPEEGGFYVPSIKRNKEDVYSVKL